MKIKVTFAAWTAKAAIEIDTSADLRGVDLSRANLYGANLSGADLRGADLRGADLRGVDLSRANLYGVNLSRVNLRGANLYGVNLCGADLRGANLYGVNLRGADLRGVDLSGVKNAELAIAKTVILPEGDLIVWKKCNNGVIVKLLIPAKSKRSSASGRKCRAEYAKVLKVFGAKIGVSQHDPKTKYAVGKIVKCDKWCDDRWQECAGGIHFYLTRIEAENH